MQVYWQPLSWFCNCNEISATEKSSLITLRLQGSHSFAFMKYHVFSWLSLTFITFFPYDSHAVQLFQYNKMSWLYRRPALVAPSLGVVGTSRSSVRIAWPTTTTDEDNVGSFGLKEMDERRTESGEGLPLQAASGQRRTSSPTGLRRFPRLVRRVSASSISFSHYLPNPLD